MGDRTPAGTTGRYTMATAGRDWTIELVREDGQWAAVCLTAPAMGVASCGDTIGEALENAVDAIDVYLRTVEASS